MEISKVVKPFIKRGRPNNFGNIVYVNHIYIYIYICVCVCECIYIYIFFFYIIKYNVYFLLLFYMERKHKTTYVKK